MRSTSSDRHCGVPNKRSMRLESRGTEPNNLRRRSMVTWWQRGGASRPSRRSSRSKKGGRSRPPNAVGLTGQVKHGELEDAARHAVAAQADAESRLARITAANRTTEADLADARSIVQEVDRLRATVKQLRSALIEERTARWSADALVSEAERSIAGLRTVRCV